MSALFEDSELCGRSLFGLKCNANKSIPIREAIDPIRRDAIIGSCWLNAFANININSN